MKRTFRARVSEVEYEIPSTMGVLEDAQEASGVTLMDALSPGSNDLSRFIRGVIFAGLVQQGVKEIDGEPLTFDSLRAAIDMRETADNQMAFMRAMTPDIPDAPKNAPKEPDPSPGKRSKGTGTDSSN